MSGRVSPVEGICREIDSLFAEGRDLVGVVEDAACLGARLIIQTVVEAEVDAFLGRARYQRAATAVGQDEAVLVRAPQWSPGLDREDHGRADDRVPAQAARHQ